MQLRYWLTISLLLGSLPWRLAYADDDYGNWIVRASAAGLLPSSKTETISDGVPRVGTPFIGDGVGGTMDISYFLFDHLALVGSAGYFPGQNGTLSGVTFTGVSTLEDSGSVSVFPVAALVQYNMAPYGEIRPYVGAGIVYPLVDASYKELSFSTSAGPALQVGFDWWGPSNWGFNTDIRYYQMKLTTDYSKILGPGVNSTVNVNPVILSMGVAYRF